jgi:SRSO17 transposase
MPSSGWYSKKFNKAGLTYELAVALFSNKIVWVNGPFPAGQNDIRVFRKPNGLLSKLPKGHPAIADEGYRGEEEYCSTRNPYDSNDVKYFKGRAKARHETVNSRLKAFGILAQPLRTNGGSHGRLDRHKMAFEACLVIIQYELDNGSCLLRI